MPNNKFKVKWLIWQELEIPYNGRLLQKKRGIEPKSLQKPSQSEADNQNGKKFFKNGIKCPRNSIAYDFEINNLQRPVFFLRYSFKI